LLDFVLVAGDDRRTAELAAQLEQVHRERGDSRSADRFGELRRRYQRAAGLSDADLATATAPPAQTASEMEEAAIAEIEALPVVPAAVPPAAAKAPEPEEVTASQPAAASHEEQVQEVDLSDEWASLLEAKAQANAPGAPAPAAAQPPTTEEFSIEEE